MTGGYIMATESLKEQFKNNKRTLLKDQFLTIKVNGYFCEAPSIIYCGNSEIEAYKKFKTLEGEPRKILKADVTFCYILDTNMIEDYVIKEVIEDRKI